VESKRGSFHDQLAQAARRDGGTAASIRRSARQYANATLVLLAIGVVVWSVGSWEWAVIPLVLSLFLGAQGYSDRLVAARLEKLEKEP
jgi:hypothetical protein